MLDTMTTPSIIRERADAWLSLTDVQDPHSCDEVHPLARAALKLLAVVEALPTCDEPGCGAQATRHGTVVRVCDAHSWHTHSDLPYAAALRALLAP